MTDLEPTSGASELVPGGLVIAGNLATRRDHIVRLRRSAYDDDVDQLRTLAPKKRTAAIAKIDESRRDLWSASGICGVRGEKSTFGNRQTYYWRPRRRPRAEDVCGDCWREWQVMDRPEIIGWNPVARLDDESAWPWPLPFGWRAVPVEGHPWDVPADEPIKRVRDQTGQVVGQHRVELRRWTRGPRIVRLVQMTDRVHGIENTHSARYWQSGSDPDQEGHGWDGPLPQVMRECQKLMAKGGY